MSGLVSSWVTLSKLLNLWASFFFFFNMQNNTYLVLLLVVRIILK